MSAKSKQPYKRCIVPKCGNTTSRTPGKIFVTLPSDVHRRKLWLRALHRYEESISTASRAFVCEDHFNLKNDAENYVRHRMMGVAIKIKMDVVPHIFTCQDGRKHFVSRAIEKRNNIQLVQDALKAHDEAIRAKQQSLTVHSEDTSTPVRSVGSQVNIVVPNRSRGTQFVSPFTKTRACSPIRYLYKDAATQTLPATTLRCAEVEEVSSSSDVSDVESVIDSSSSWCPSDN